MSEPTTFMPQEFIRKKRDAEPLPAEDIDAFVRGLTDGSVTDGQVAAFAMAVHFQGMSFEECVALTRAMTDSGTRLTWPGLDGPVLDKHSTGGIGDKVSLMLAPILAACGGYVPMISGRGLGHTGGTLDKLDAIPGYVTTPSKGAFHAAVHGAGCAIVGQTGELAPADDRFYAIRDVTATVDPIGLITASILSKKLAGGLQALVMDVKFGTGAFSPDLEEATELARSIARVATDAGLPTHALLTDMNQVMGRTAGNALETREAVDYLCGAAREPRIHELITALGAELLVMGGLADDLDAGAARVQQVLADGSAVERFQRMVSMLGGPADFVEAPAKYLPVAALVRDVHAPEPGVVQCVDGRALGMAIVEMGGGRKRPDDVIDYTVGISDVLGRGETTDAGRPLFRLHASSEAVADRAAAALRATFTVGADVPEIGPVVAGRLGGSS